MVARAKSFEVDRPREPRERRRRGSPASPQAVMRAGERPASAGRDGGSSPHARMIARSIWSAREAWISCPQTPRITACVTVAFRRVRIPRRRWTAGPISGSRACSRWNSLVSSSSASMKRASSTARSHEARTTTRPSRSCCAAAQRPPASFACHEAVPAVSRSEYGPVALSTASTIEPAYRPPRTRYFLAMRLADAISLRSRRRKLQLFLDELRPDARRHRARRRRRRARLRRRRRLRDDELLRGECRGSAVRSARRSADGRPGPGAARDTAMLTTVKTASSSSAVVPPSRVIESASSHLVTAMIRPNAISVVKMIDTHGVRRPSCTSPRTRGSTSLVRHPVQQPARHQHVDQCRVGDGEHRDERIDVLHRQAGCPGLDHPQQRRHRRVLELSRPGTRATAAIDTKM